MLESLSPIAMASPPGFLGPSERFQPKVKHRHRWGCTQNPSVHFGGFGVALRPKIREDFKVVVAIQQRS